MNERDISRDGFRELLSKKMPLTAVDHCFALWSEFPFAFKLKKRRATKLGDYRYDPRDQSHTITLNSDLNPYQFLITYVHEVAHRVAHRPKGNQKPHGPEWKSTFRNLILPVLNPEVFPDDLLRALAQHMRNPKASTAGDPKLVKILAQYNEYEDQVFTINDVAIGGEFTFRKRVFRKLEKKRTRMLCLDLKNGKKYLISGIAEIQPLDEIKVQVPTLLSEIKQGKTFRYKNRTFKKMEKKRTHSLCLDLDQRAIYSIPESMEVEEVS